MILFDESAEAYHANEAIGSTDIRDFLRSPRLFKDRQDGIQRKETPALLFGTASHMALLEPIRFARSAAFKPKGMKFSTKEGIAWRDAHEAEGRIIVEHDDAEALQMMHLRMPAEVREIFARCRPEVTVRGPMDGLICQIRVDMLDLDGGRFFDLKTIDRIEDIEKSVYKYGYHIQERWYSRLLKAETGRRLAGRFVFVEKKAPFRWRIVELDADFVLIGDRAVIDAIDGIAARIKSGCWDDPGSLHEMVSPPEWATQELDEDELP